MIILPTLGISFQVQINQKKTCRTCRKDGTIVSPECKSNSKGLLLIRNLQRSNYLAIVGIPLREWASRTNNSTPIGKKKKKKINLK